MEKKGEGEFFLTQIERLSKEIPEAPEEVRGISELEQEGDYLVEEMKDAGHLLMTWYVEDLIDINGKLQKKYNVKYSPKDFSEEITGAKEIIQDAPEVNSDRLLKKMDNLKEAISWVDDAIAEGDKKEAKKHLKILRSRRNKMKRSKLFKTNKDFLMF